MSADRVPASTEMTAGIALGCSLRCGPRIDAGRSDAIAANIVMGAIRRSAGSHVDDTALVRGNATDATAQIDMTTSAVITALRGRSPSSVPT
jgi:hypothetical protein